MVTYGALCTIAFLEHFVADPRLPAGVSFALGYLFVWGGQVSRVDVQHECSVCSYLFSPDGAGVLGYQ